MVTLVVTADAVATKSDVAGTLALDVEVEDPAIQIIFHSSGVGLLFKVSLDLLCCHP